MSRKDCSACHTPNPSDAKWCRNCGRMFLQSKTIQEKPNENQSANKPSVRKTARDKKMKPWLLLLVPVVLFGLFCLVSYIKLINFNIYSSYYDLSPEGGSERIHMDSNGCNYYVVRSPYWIEVSVETSSGFSITYEKNDTGRSRDDYFIIRAYNWIGSESRSFDIHQEPSSNPNEKNIYSRRAPRYAAY